MINLNKLRLYFNPIDKITLGYILTTLVYIILSLGKLDEWWLHILYRLVLITLICWLAWISPRLKNRFWLFIRNAYPLILFGFFYSETDYLNNVLFNNLDPFFERIELWLFGVHPSIIFSQSFPQIWFSEFMNFGYFSYYILILLLPLWLWFKNRQSSYHVIFIITLSFYLFYWLFILFPVAGPQFYFAESLRSVPNAGIFRCLVRLAEWIGEGPTAAFPSSHVGLMMILAYLSYRYAKELFLVYIFFGLLICFSTVYIKAHYAIDVIGGFLFAPLFFIISNWAFSKLSKSQN
jgi:membrane-associated phospholipid phosphatase